MKKFILILVSFLAVNSFALDPAQEAALKQTQDMLRNEKERAALIKEDPKARAADRKASIITIGSKEDKNEMYDVSAELLQWVVSQGGDPAKLMEKYQNNPVQFLNDMPPEQRQRIQALAESIEQRRKVRKPAGTP